MSLSVRDLRHDHLGGPGCEVDVERLAQDQAGAEGVDRVGERWDKGEGGGTRQQNRRMSWCRISQAACATLLMCSSARKPGSQDGELDDSKVI